MSGFFIYKAGIPFQFARAVMNIIRDKAILTDWDKLREYRENAFFYAWIQSILEDNEVTGAKADIGWWKAKILGN